MRAVVALAALALAGCIPPGPDTPRASSDQTPYPDQRDTSADARWEPQRFDEGVTGVQNPRPAWEARPVAADAKAVPPTDYTVRPGDTLRAIGNRTGAGSEAIARANALSAPFTIRPGQRLRIPGGRYHEVQPGQSGIAISRAYGVDWSRIVTANGLEEPYVLRVGQRVLIPGDAPIPRTAAERAAAFHLDIEDLVTGAEPAIAESQRPARPVAGPTRVLPPTVAVAAPASLRGGFDWPLRGTILARFGRGASGIRNDGIKIAAPLNTPIHAAADGNIVYAGTGVAGLGGLVMVKHGDGWTSVYGHASRLLVQRGQAVKRGDVIAYSGDSGFADRAQLHFELRKGRVAIDPVGQLPR